MQKRRSNTKTDSFQDKKTQKFKENGKQKRGTKNSKPRGKVEIDVSDSDINAADLRPFDKRRSKGFDNDFSWYNHYPLLAENVSGVNYATPVGANIKYLKYGSAATNKLGMVYPTAPGVCTIKYIPTYGVLDGTTQTPLSRVWAQMYSAMRIKLGSRADYDPTDTMLYLMAMDSAYIVYAVAVKYYGLSNQISPFNYYVMDKLCKSIGFNWSSLLTNLASFRAAINQYAIALSKYMVPADIDLYKRRLWLIQNTFVDSDTAKAQQYTFMPEGYYYLVEETSGDKKLAWKSFPSNITVDDMLNIFTDILIRLDSSQDMVQMSADIGKAWDGTTLAASLIPETYSTPIGYSKEVLSQIENITLAGAPLKQSEMIDNLDITVIQDLTLTMGPRLQQKCWTRPTEYTGGFVTGDTGKTIANACVAQQGFLNFHWSNVTNADTIIASRGTVSAIRANVPGSLTDTCIEWGARGSELFTVAILNQITESGDLVSLQYMNFMKADAANSVVMGAAWTAFDWAPQTNFIYRTGSTDKVVHLGDIDTYGVVDSEQLAEMHYNCILSEFYSPRYPESVVNMPMSK